MRLLLSRWVVRKQSQSVSSPIPWLSSHVVISLGSVIAQRQLSLSRGRSDLCLVPAARQFAFGAIPEALAALSNVDSEK